MVLLLLLLLDDNTAICTIRTENIFYWIFYIIYVKLKSTRWLRTFQYRTICFLLVDMFVIHHAAGWLGDWVGGWVCVYFYQLQFHSIWIFENDYISIDLDFIWLVDYKSTVWNYTLFKLINSLNLLIVYRLVKITWLVNSMHSLHKHRYYNSVVYSLNCPIFNGWNDLIIINK